MADVKLPSVETEPSPEDTTLTVGTTFTKDRLMACGLPSCEITSEVKVANSPGAALDTVSVRPVPAPKTASWNVPDRMFVDPFVTENVPAYSCETNVTPLSTKDVALEVLVALSVRDAVKGVEPESDPSIAVTVIGTLVAQILVLAVVAVVLAVPVTV